MRPAIKVSRETLLDLLDDAEEVDSDQWRHGRRVQYHVRYEESDYLVWLDVHHEEGVQTYGDVTLKPAEKRERVVSEWVEVQP